VTLADGVAVPLADESVDFVLSLQVLEHVPGEAARHIVREIARVLRPGGRAFLAFENYCSFWEPHYRVRWFPLLPKSIGAIYLTLLGRDPAFLHDHIYYNSALRLAVACYDAGLASPYWNRLARKLEDPALVLGRLQRQVARLVHIMPRRLKRLAIVWWAERSQLMRTTFQLELVHG
jgi:SAM-dependent methyltransferase